MYFILCILIEFDAFFKFLIMENLFDLLFMLLFIVSA